MAKHGQALRKARPVKKPAKPAVAVKQQIAELKRELAQAMERQAATAGVLKEISRSTFDLRTVLEKLGAAAIRLCSAERGFVLRLDGEALRYTVGHNLSPELREFLEGNPIPLVPTSINGRAALERRTVHIPDVRNYPEYSYAGIQVDPPGTVLSVPMCKAEQLIGVFCIYRYEVRPFTDSQIALMETFADQAVIAIENARLVGELRERTGDLEESLKYQTATSDVLKVISRSTSDLQRVLDTLIETAAELCETSMAAVAIRRGDVYRYVATARCSPEYDQALRSRHLVAGRDSIVSRVLLERKVVHIVDAEREPGYNFPDAINIGRVRTLLGVPMFREDELVGVIGLSRQHVEPFTEKQIELVHTFANQAVIAIENARLLGELRERTADLQESLEYQTATSDVLKVMSRSTFDLQPILDTLVQTAARLCQADTGLLADRDGDVYRGVATFAYSPDYAAFWRDLRLEPTRATITGRVAIERRVIHIIDTAADPEYVFPESIALGKNRTLLGVPLLREGEPIGVISLGRERVEPFTKRQIELVRTFADQAVIAIENARLITETREALEQQTATADVLKLISRSTFNLQPVLDTLVETAARLCNADAGSIWRQDGEVFRAIGVCGFREDAARLIRESRLSPGRGTVTARTILEGRPIHILDVRQDPEYTWSEIIERAGLRAMLGVPMIREGMPIGAFSLHRMEARPFTDKQIELVTTFADQAVIAIENARLIAETREALERQTATSEVLQVINASPGDLKPVFEAMLDKALRLCDGSFGTMQRHEGDHFRMLACRNVPPPFEDFLTRPMQALTGGALHRLLRGDAFVQIVDVQDGDLSTPGRRALVEFGRARTVLWIPLRKESAVVGAFVIYRQEVKPFTDKQIALLQNFAAQAVIAMENARLVTETREALEQQTATAEVLQVINNSPGELSPVFDAILEKAHHLCGATNGLLVTRDREYFRTVAARDTIERDAIERDAELLRRPFQAMPNSPHRLLSVGERVVHITDVMADTRWDRNDPRRAIAIEHGLRTMLFVGLRKDDALLGYIGASRHEVRPFSDKEIALLESFAAQAVIAMENGRLLGELRERTADLARSVDELTATGDVLKIISRSSVDLETVLDTLVETVARLCRADHALMFRRREDLYHLFASRGITAEAKNFFVAHPFAAGRETVTGRTALERRAVHIADVLRDPAYTYEAPTLTGARTLLGIPLLREEALGGIFVIGRTRVEPFTNKEIELATTFADQAVIAVENARLFEELRERQSELRVTFDNMGDGVVMFDTAARLAAWNRNLQEILDLPDAFLANRPSYAEYFRYLAERGEYAADLEAELSRTIEDTSRELRFERTRPDGRVIEVRRNRVPGGGFVLIYADITERKRAEETIRAARDAAEAALRELQAAQASLLHAQKMAALGQLTAGIAHEIKNPLNFVNNFAGLSVELLDELKEAAAQAMGALDADKRAEIVETIGMLTSNLAKIAEHGRRADGIVRSMLQHSRGGSGERQLTDLNALVEEALNLAYHGARAQNQSFNITMERDFDRDLAPIEVVPQDVTRVFLNLIGNGFYAASKRGREDGSTFRPVLKVATREAGEVVEIRVRDNGVGIPPEYREKLFQPFFTTKPTGEGTGLGLSISYEIITQQHGGTITVDSEEGQFTEFTVRLPRRRHLAAGTLT